MDFFDITFWCNWSCWVQVAVWRMILSLKPPENKRGKKQNKTYHHFFCVCVWERAHQFVLFRVKLESENWEKFTSTCNTRRLHESTELCTDLCSTRNFHNSLYQIKKWKKFRPPALTSKVCPSRKVRNKDVWSHQ